MMQRAAFIFDVGNPVSMVAVTAGRAVIVSISQSRLAFEDMHGVVEHHWHDANNLCDQKQPEEPRAKAAFCVQEGQRPPLDLDVPPQTDSLSCAAKPA